MIKLSKLEEELLKEKFPIKADFDNALARLERREPLAYILGEWYFYSETYKVSPNCLIPRPETEHLVDELIKSIPKNGRFADLCTGSGCVAISTLVHRPDITAVAVDISHEALELAKENALLNGVSDRITFINEDVLSGNVLGNEIYDCIASNPPYIVSEVIDTLEPEVLMEPRIALDGGRDGLDFYRILYTEYKNNVKHGGYIICEIGYDQGGVLADLYGCEIKKDYSGNNRVAKLTLK